MDLDLDGVDDLSINKEFADRFTHNHKRAELQRLQEKYKEESDESSDSDQSDEDEQGDQLTPDIDAALLKTLSLLKSKDPSIYSDKKVFEEEQAALKDKAAQLTSKRTKLSGKPVTLADFERQKLLKGDFGSDEEGDDDNNPVTLPTHAQEQRNLKKEVTSAFHSGNDDNEDQDDFLKPKSVEDDDDFQSRNSYKKFLLDNVGEDEIRKALGLDDVRISSTQQEIDNASNPNPTKEEKKLAKKAAKSEKPDNQEKSLKTPSKAYQKAKDDQFLMDYILNQGWMPGSSTSVPKDVPISNQKAAEKGHSFNLSGANADNELLEDDDDFEDYADDFEHRYNFRFEEPNADDIKTHSRQLESTVRRSDNKRKEQRASKKERKEVEKRQREEDLKRLKSLKKDDIKSRLAAIGEDAAKFEHLDLDAEFDPEAHDKAMRDAYENEYDEEGDEGEFDEEKPQWEDDIDIDDIVAQDDPQDDSTPINMDADYNDQDDQNDGKVTMSKRERKKAKKKAKADAKGATKEGYDEDDVDMDMDADHLTHQPQEEEPMPATAEERQAALEKWLDEYYKLDYEDTIGDLKTRFKYTNVVPDSYGLNTDEILRADDRDLTRLMRVKRMAPYRKDRIANSGKGKYANGMMSRVREFKHKVNNDRPAWGEDSKDFKHRKHDKHDGKKRPREGDGDIDSSALPQPPKKKKIDTPLFFDSGDEWEEENNKTESDLEIVASTPAKRKHEDKLSREDTDVVEITAKTDETRYNRFIGEIIISGWSTVNGKGYARSGEQVLVERDKNKQAEKTGKNGKNGKGKTSTLKGFAAKSSNKSENTIIRFRNMRGFEVGRLPSNHTSYLSRLLDKQIIELTGTLMDCDETLRSGDTIILSLQVYLHPKAFAQKNSSKSNSNNTDGQASKISQSEESQQEKELAGRQEALMKVFHHTSLSPIESSSVTQQHRRKGALNGTSQIDHFKQAASQIHSVDTVNTANTDTDTDNTVKNNTNTTHVMDKSVINIDSSDDEHDQAHDNAHDRSQTPDKVDDEQLRAVYSRAGGTSRNLMPIDAVDSFNLTLRNYQKEALSWMSSMESGESEEIGKNGRSRSCDPHPQAMHPLWEKYRFRDHPQSTTHAEYFYFNPYSSELSDTFPSANKTLRGGIQGDEMGMGKTIMIAALLHHHKNSDLSWHQKQINTVKPGKQQRIDAVGSKQSKSAPIKIDQSDSDNDYQLSQSQEIRDTEDGKPKKKRKQNTSTSAKNPSQSRQPGGFKALNDTTLVIVPMSLLGQWRDEIERCSAKGSVRTIVYYGENRGNLENQLRKRTKVEDENGNVIDYSNCFNVVITSYGVLISDYQTFVKSSNEAVTVPTILDYYWHRVVIDEAHHIKNRSTLNAKAAFEIAAYRRWALTGTPIVNRLEDLYSLLKFLKVEPWSDFTFFKSFITAPFVSQDPKAIELIQVIMSSCLLRREKNMRDSDGKPIVTLPKKIVNVEKLDFSPEERQIYNAIFKKAKRKFDALSHKGMLLKSYSNIFAMLLRLRQAALHPFLVTSGGNKKDTESDEVEDDDGGVAGIDIQSMIAKFAAGGDSNYAKQVLSELANGVHEQTDMSEEDNECPICFENMSIPVLLPCMHKSCKQCVLGYFDRLEDKGEMTSCPVCRNGPIRTDQLLEVVYGEPTSQNDQVVKLRKAHNFQSSAKLRALTGHLQRLREVEGKFKAVVFSQFTAFLDLVGDSLIKDKIHFLRLDGSTSQKNREIVLNDLDRGDNSVVLLISLRAGGVGLNLTSANHVFMMDVWWNEAIEKQAIDRVHRIGQEKDVHVVRFCIQDSIEDRVMHIQKRKTALVDNALGGKSSEENKQERIANLNLIFSQ
ncbi:hypothetical protein E3P89_01653 [Wallemia ichthyophaga]|uniref:DNA repair protein RAD5 n=1 Tax=Wallemia ichthyophaga TaxID=245174 RepID=A0A4T0ID39_WALIC|nr:hypothetical protein E3P93_01805 [Wallemia ichthyophaga]TIB17055.1 hypothetical protein E3P90_00231 [Wallemia ichthyophaga]TIB23219.1 hypothetical protein E3P89_01653 [Wallemia ichthyophaga]TIB27349.1 hypothetical protein E3P88_00231 [Wallemia ichthyophaga]